MLCKGYTASKHKNQYYAKNFGSQSTVLPFIAIYHERAATIKTMWHIKDIIQEWFCIENLLKVNSEAALRFRDKVLLDSVFISSFIKNQKNSYKICLLMLIKSKLPSDF